MTDDKSDEPTMLFTNPKVVDINGRPIIDGSLFGAGKKHYSFVVSVPGKPTKLNKPQPNIECISRQNEDQE